MEIYYKRKNVIKYIQALDENEVAVVNIVVVGAKVDISVVVVLFTKEAYKIKRK